METSTCCSPPSLPRLQLRRILERTQVGIRQVFMEPTRVRCPVRCGRLSCERGRSRPRRGGPGRLKPPSPSFPFLSPQTTTAPTASPLTRWPACIATWTSCTSSGVTARSQPPFPSLRWSSGRPTSPSPSTGCPRSVGWCTTGERGLRPGWAEGFLRGVSAARGGGCGGGGGPAGNCEPSHCWGAPSSLPSPVQAAAELVGSPGI